jgi:phosphoserine phosphatase
MNVPQNVIALIFDFDDTLTDDSTTALLREYGVDPGEFWNGRVKARVESGWDPALAYLDLLLELSGPGKSLARLTNQRLAEFGASLSFYRGIPQLFKDLRKMVSKHTTSNPSIEFYIISGGPQEIIQGTPIAKYFSGIWGCTFEEAGGRVAKVKNVISFTEKTKYLFLINKGLGADAQTNAYVVNQYMPEETRRIPWKNMIYVGDGLTDVPCFSLIQRSGGKAFGVFDPTKEGSPRKAWMQLVAPQRVATMNSPRYGEKDDLGALIRAAVTGICLDLDTRSHRAL